MSKIPPLQRISTEDFPEQAGWIERLAQPINSAFERITAAMNKGLTINDNMAGSIMTVELNGTWPVKIAWTQPQRPISVLVGNVYRSDGASFTLSAATQVQWQFNQSGQLQLDGITGITPTSTTKYKIVLECKAG